MDFHRTKVWQNSYRRVRQVIVLSYKEIRHGIREAREYASE